MKLTVMIGWEFIFTFVACESLLCSPKDLFIGFVAAFVFFFEDKEVASFVFTSIEDKRNPFAILFQSYNGDVCYRFSYCMFIVLWDSHAKNMSFLSWSFVLCSYLKKYLLSCYDSQTIRKFVAVCGVKEKASLHEVCFYKEIVANKERISMP